MVLFALWSVSVLIKTIFGTEKMTGCVDCLKLGNMLLYVKWALLGMEINGWEIINKETNNKALYLPFKGGLHLKINNLKFYDIITIKTNNLDFC